MKGIYLEWKITKESIVASGPNKKFVHYFPKEDFFTIMKKFLLIIKKEGIISRFDVLNEMHNIKLSENRIFNKETHIYKIKIVFDILIKEGYIERKGIKKYPKHQGKSHYGFVLKAPAQQIEQWLANLSH